MEYTFTNTVKCGLDKVEHGCQSYTGQLGRQLSLGNIDYSELQSGDRKAWNESLYLNVQYYCFLAQL